MPGCSEPAYNGIYPDACLSKSTAYMGLHPDGDPSRGFLKDESSSTLDARSQPIIEYTLMVVRAGQLPIYVFTLTGPSGGFLKDRGSPTLDARSQPIMGYTLMAARAGQPSIWVFTLMTTLRGLPERRRFAHVGCS